jgi:hypothetical protein
MTAPTLPHTPATITIPQAAARLRISYNVAMRRVLLGELEGYQDDAGRWHVIEASLPIDRAARSSERRSEPVDTAR